MTIDRENRDRLAETTRRFLAEEISAFEFDERIMDTRDHSHDPTLNAVVGSLWYFYDDLKDHTAALCKAEWDFIQRLLLILESDAQVHVESRRYWTPAQFAAMLVLAAYVACAASLGFGYHLIIHSIPFGLVSILLSSWRRRYERQFASSDPLLDPFSSMSEIRAVRAAASGFRKQRFPPHLQDVSVRSKSEHRLNRVMHYGAWLLYAPIVLAVQSLPSVQCMTHVRIESDAHPAASL